MCVLSTCMWMNHVHALYPQNWRVMHSCELLGQCWETSWSPQQEKTWLLIAQQFLQPPQFLITEELVLPRWSVPQSIDHPKHTHTHTHFYIQRFIMEELPLGSWMSFSPLTLECRLHRVVRLPCLDPPPLSPFGEADVVVGMHIFLLPVSKYEPLMAICT